MLLTKEFKKKLEFRIKEYEFKILVPELVGEEYLSWFNDPGAKNYIKYSKENLITLQSLKEYTREKYESPNAIFFGIFSGKIHLGNIKFEPIDMELKGTVMGILLGNPSFRSKGLGTLFLNECSQLLHRHLGLTFIELNVRFDNYRAVKSYEKCGFVEVVDGFLIKNNPKDVITMRLSF
jgi:ribosomal-protein-alanine N-acetyltransferase